MPIRSVTKKYSDRGSLKDLVSIKTDDLDPPTTFELRLKKMYEYEEIRNNTVYRSNTVCGAISSAIGFIVMKGSDKREEYPVTLYRHREYINNLSSSLKDKIAKTRKELEKCFNPTIDLPREIKLSQFKQKNAREIILNSENIIKVANYNCPIYLKRSFRRVS